MTHFIYPEIPGFEQAGGLTGPKVDYNEHPEGDMAVAEKYMKLAGYPSGKYTGGKTIQIVGSKGNPAEQDAEIVNQTLKNLGFKTKFTLVEHVDDVREVLQRPPKKRSTSARASAGSRTSPTRRRCSNVTFNGKIIINETGNVNWGQVNDPTINAAMDRGRTGRRHQAARATAWAKIDDETRRGRRRCPVRLGQAAQRRVQGRRGVGDLWNVGEWDYSFTSLK